MAGWQDAPLITAGKSTGSTSWQNAPLVGGGAPPSPLDRLPPETSPTAQPQKNADSIANRLLGFGEAGLSAITGAAGGAAGQLYGIGKTLTGGKYGTQQGIQEGEKAGVELANKLTYQPRTQTGQQLTEGLGKALSASRLEGLPPDLFPRVPEIPGAALRAGEAVGGAAGKGARAVGQQAAKALPTVDAETAALARDAHAMGFRLTPDQVLGNKYAKAIGEAAGSVPLSGSNFKYNQGVFDKQLVNMIGGVGDKLTRKTYAEAMKNAGTTIGDIAEKTPVPVNQSFISGLRANGANQLPEVSGVVNGFVDQIDKAAGKPQTLLGGGRTAGDRVLDGVAFRRINTAIAKRMRETANGDLRSALSNLQDDLLEHRSQFMDSRDRVAYDQARKFYAIGKTLEPLVAKAPTGEISPSLLLGTLNRNALGKSLVSQGAAGDLGKLADIGQRFLKGQPSSGTAERMFAQGIPAALGGLVGAGAAGAPGAALGLAGTLGAANLYNRAGPALTERLISRPPP